MPRLRPGLWLSFGEDGRTGPHTEAGSRLPRPSTSTFFKVTGQMADHQSPPRATAARNNLARPTASLSIPGLPVAPRFARSASAGASIVPAAASTLNSALPLRRSVRTALSGWAQRIYSTAGCISTQQIRSDSQGSLISAAINPTFSPQGSPESPQFQTPTEADRSLSPWPRARSVASNFEAHSPLGNLHFSSPDRQPLPQVAQPCPLRLALMSTWPHLPSTRFTTTLRAAVLMMICLISSTPTRPLRCFHGTSSPCFQGAMKSRPATGTGQSTTCLLVQSITRSLILADTWM